MPKRRAADQTSLKYCRYTFSNDGGLTGGATTGSATSRARRTVASELRPAVVMLIYNSGNGSMRYCPSKIPFCAQGQGARDGQQLLHIAHTFEGQARVSGFELHPQAEQDAEPS